MIFKKFLVVLSSMLFFSFIVTADSPKNAGDFVSNRLIVKFRSEVTEKVKKGIGAKAEVSGKDAKALLNACKVGLNTSNLKLLFSNFKNKQKQYATILEKGKANKKLTQKEERLVRRQKRAPAKTAVPDLSGICIVTLEQGESVTAALAQLKNNPQVEYAAPDFITQLDVAPNDPYYADTSNDYQWYLNNTGNNYPTSGRLPSPPGTADADIDAPEAWNLITGGTDVVVAILDSGVDYAHRDLVDNLWINETEENGTAGVDDDGNGYVDDVYGYNFNRRESDTMDYLGHGTHCAGIVAAEGNNNTDIAGVCWDARIMSVRIADESGIVLGSSAIEGIYYAIEMGADVLSNSWGGGFPYNQPLQDVINYAYSRGVVFVASAGNNSSSNIQYPAGNEHVIAVANTNSDDARGYASNYGEWVDVAAPGTDILSLRAAGTEYGKVFNDYLTTLSGTSMACPVVSGIAALLLAYNPTLTVDQVTSLISNNGDPIADGICASDRRVNAYQTLSAAITRAGKIRLDKDVYSTSSTIYISVTDSDLDGIMYQDVVVHASQDYETVRLYPVASGGVFRGSIQASSGTAVRLDSILQLTDSSYFWAEYNDADDGSGNPNTDLYGALVDFTAPAIQDKDYESAPLGPRPVISVVTNEDAVISIRYGTSTPPSAYTDSRFGSSVSIPLKYVQPNTTYYFEIQATDKAGNTVIDNNLGAYYQFTSSVQQSAVTVSVGQSIQAAIDAAWDGTVITIQPGTYYEAIDLKGKKITLTGTDPDNWATVSSTIISLEGTSQVFAVSTVSGESRECIIQGLTFSSLVANGRGLHSVGSSPTVRKCKFVGRAEGIIANFGCEIAAGSPLITDCITYGFYYGIYSTLSKPVVQRCDISAAYAGMVLDNHTTVGEIENNVIHNNGGYGIAVWGYQNGPIKNNLIYSVDCGMRLTDECANVLISGNTIFGCTSAGVQIDAAPNLDDAFRGTYPTITNCIIWNTADDIKNNSIYTVPVIQYSCIEDSDTGTGVIHTNPGFVDAPNNNFHITSSSPCYNTGDSSYAAATGETDIDGNNRVLNSRIDMGADEVSS